MKKSNFAENKKMEKAALIGKSSKLREEIAGLVIDKSMNKMKNLKSISGKRRELAQTLTVLRQKELLEQLEKESANG